MSETWSTILQVVAGSAAAAGVLFGLAQLRSVAMQARFASTVAFHEILQSHSSLFLRLIDEFPLDRDPASIARLNHAQRCDAHEAVNALNVIGQLVEDRLVEARPFFSLAHVNVIRLTYLLQPYMEYIERRQGSAYGHRLVRIADRAKRFHDLSPSYWNTPITLTRFEDQVTEIHRPRYMERPKRPLRARVECGLRRRLRRF